MQLSPCQKAIDLVIKTYAPNLNAEAIESNYAYSKAYLEMRAAQYVYSHKFEALMVGLFRGGYEFRMNIGPLVNYSRPSFTLSPGGRHKEVTLIVDDPVSAEALGGWYEASLKLNELRHELGKLFHDVGPTSFFSYFPEVPSEAKESAYEEWRDHMVRTREEYVSGLHSLLREASKVGHDNH